MSKEASRYGEPETDRHLTLKDCAERASVTERTILRYITDGLLPARRLGPKLWRVRESDFTAFLEGGE